MPKWTPEQLKAIESRDGTVLVSAAAGSGKTAVLVERVIRRLTDPKKPCSADRLLIVTFTKAATQQMREKIFQAISDKIAENPNDAHLKRQLVMLPFAHISTIDSFCNEIVRDNFHDIDLAPDYKLLEGAQLRLLESDAVARTLDELYAEDSEEFTALLELICTGTDDSAVADLIRRLYNNSTAYAQPDRWLDGLLKGYNTDEPLARNEWGRIIINRVSDTAAHYKKVAEEMKRYTELDDVVKKSYLQTVEEIESAVGSIESAVTSGDWNCIKNTVGNISLGRMKRLPTGYTSPYADYIKAQKTAFSGNIKELSSLMCATEEENDEEMRSLRPIAFKLISAVKRYGEILAEEKRRINSVDFSDISHFALRLLIKYDADGNRERTALAKSYAEKFDEILVDEFQDINDIQNDLFWAISDNESNLFTVGDVKQSIYRFRKAMPEIFLRRRDSMPPYKEGRYPGKIVLDRNFRSRRGVTENVNFVFKQLMSKQAGGLDYDENEELVAGADYAECDHPQTELYVIGDIKTDRAAEAQCIADLIKNDLKSGFTVKDGDSVRKATYKDYCILMRSTSGDKAAKYADVLTENNIPVYISNRAGFFTASEISTVINLMRIIDNPVQDIPLLAVMLSPLFGFSADEVAELRIDERRKPIYHCITSAAENNKKCAAFLDKLEELRMFSSTLSCSDFVRELYDATGCKAVANAMPNGSQRNANLNLLLDYASDYEASGGRGLSGFIRFIDRVQAQNGDLETASDISEAADVVRIMTIHKSKGLEFPVCILADLNCKVKNDNRSGTAAFHPDHGICFTYRNSKTMCKHATVGRKALSVAEGESSVSEELRVLYVAMTRAKEKLVMMTRYDNLEKKLSSLAAGVSGREPVAPFVVHTSGSMADWIVTAYMRHPNAVELRAIAGSENMKLLDASEAVKVTVITEISEAQADKSSDTGKEAVVDEELYKEIERRVSYEYPYAAIASVRAKSAPSEFDKTGFSLKYFALSKPQFLSKSGMNPAARGTAMHKFMEFYDYTSSDDIDTQAQRMVRENRLTADEAGVLERSKLESFFKSDIARRIRESDMLMREKQVTVGIRAGELYKDLPENVRDETVVIQGYVDCAFEEDGELVIVDYKTDRNADMEELRDRYFNQLKMYEYALGRCTGKTVKCTLIYSFENCDYILLK